MLNPVHLYQIIKDIVRNYPQTLQGTNVLTCKQPQAFAVIQSQDNLAASNLLKDSRYINKPYFYSRLWNEKNQQNPSEIGFNYPLVCIAEDQNELIIGDKSQKTTFNFFILDQIPQALHPNSTICDERVIEEIFEDLRFMWLTILESMQDFIFATFTFNAQNYSGWYPQVWLHNTGGITNLVEMELLTVYWDVSEKITAGTITKGFADNLCGYAGNLTFYLDACATALGKYNFDNLTQVPDSGCC